MDKEVKQVPVQAYSWSPDRRVGQLFAKMPFAATGRDMEVRTNGTVELLVQAVPSVRLDACVITRNAVAIDADFPVTVTVDNPTANIITDVRLASLEATGEGGVTVVTLPSQNPITLNAFQSITYTGVFHSVSSGDVVFHARATGNITPAGGTPETISSAVADSDPLEIGTTIEIINVKCAPRRVNPGEEFTIRAWVHTLDENAANNVTLATDFSDLFLEGATGTSNQNDLTLHFGLGSHSGPVDLEIFAPGGGSTIVEGVAVDQTVEYATDGTPLQPPVILSDAPARPSD